MSTYLDDFIDFFGLSGFFESTLTVQEVLGYSILAFIGAVFMLAALRCVFELVKTVTDWRSMT